MEAEVNTCSECCMIDTVVSVAADAGTGYICRECLSAAIEAIDEYDGEHSAQTGES